MKLGDGLPSNGPVSPSELTEWVRFAEDTFSSPSKGKRGEKGSVRAVDRLHVESARASALPEPLGLAGRLRGHNASDEKGTTLSSAACLDESGEVHKKGAERKRTERPQGRESEAAAGEGSTLLDYRVTQAESSWFGKQSVMVSDAYGYLYKVITSGNIIELYSYDQVQCHRGGTSGRKERKQHSDEERSLMRKQNYTRTARTCRRLINANVCAHGPERPKFLTFTFREDIRDFERANYEWKKFTQRLEYRVGKTLRYVVVPEFQDKTREGVIHYHAIFFNLPYIPASKERDTRGLGYNLADIWGLGFVKINAIDNVDNVGSYVTGYMTEDFGDERYQGAKKYFASRGLCRPEEFVTDDESLVRETMAALESKRTFEATFENDYVGRVHYEQFNKGKGRIGCGKEKS